MRLNTVTFSTGGLCAPWLPKHENKSYLSVAFQSSPMHGAPVVDIFRYKYSISAAQSPTFIYAVSTFILNISILEQKNPEFALEVIKTIQHCKSHSFRKLPE